MNPTEVNRVAYCSIRERKAVEALEKFSIIADIKTIFVKSKRTTGAFSLF